MKDSRHEILNFWFVETEPALWFQVNPAFDAQLRDTFEALHGMARDGLCDSWMNDADGCLALVLLLGQFPRQMFRGTAKAYDTDDKALLLAKHAVLKGFDQLMAPEKRRFFYLPFQNSEKRSDHKRSVELFGRMQKEDPLSYEWALKDQKLIDHFDRFPKRNAVLGRENTPEEQEYLAGKALES